MVGIGAEPSDHRWLARDWIAGGVLLAATAGMILWQNAHVAVLFDVSYILNTATRIAMGRVPYRDFPLAHAPLTFLFQAAIIQLTGRVYFHHVLYAAAVGGLSTVLTWWIALNMLPRRVASAWMMALLLTLPLTVLGIYCILPNPEYDCDCGFWILVAMWGLQRAECPSRSSWRWLRGFLAGAALVVPLFFKQNMGLPFLLASAVAILAVLVARWLRREKSPTETGAPTLIAVLAGVCGALLAGVLALHFTAGLGNYVHWTVTYAGQRRLPGLDTMLGVYSYPSLAWMLPCSIVGLLLLRFSKGIHRPPHTVHESRPTNLWLQVIAFLLLAAPFLFALASLLIYDDADERGDSLLAIWPVLLVLSAALALMNLIRQRSKLTLRTFLPLILLAAIHGTLMSQQLWGSTYGIWPLLVLLLAELIAFLDGFAVRAGASCRFVPALAAFVSTALLVCGGFYTASEERLSYAYLPDGPPAHSAFPQLAGLATPGPYVPEIDELLRYAQANIPFDDGILLIPGEEPFFFATGRAPHFPVPFFDPTIDPYSPEQIAALARTRNIHWLIVKTNVQTKEDPTPDRAELMNFLMRQFTLVTHLRGYDVYQAKAAE